ncbi:hypothetical protein WN944_003080 [Citrus x changshan-huyou]|uniref:BED-type domain-containing protein n=1 Tax=Citrus x changshan-huyou TaxID=2935761 RepID=A0AAP0QGF8_9ROSI
MDLVDIHVNKMTSIPASISRSDDDFNDDLNKAKIQASADLDKAMTRGGNMSQDSVGDDDVNDIIEMEEKIEKGLRLVEKKAPRQRKLTSQVWSLFHKVSGEKYLEMMCKQCGIEYVPVRNSGTGNLKRHYETCAKFKKCDPAQMMLDRSDRMSTRVPKFEAHVFRELLSCAIIMHDFPFQFIEYEGIRRI